MDRDTDGDKKWDANRRTEAPEAVNSEQEDEEAQAQTIAEEALAARGQARGGASPESRKVHSGEPNDDVQDLVDHMEQQARSGRIDTDAFRGERNDDDEEGSLGPAGIEDDQPRGAE